MLSLPLPVLAEGEWICQYHVVAAGLLCWRMLLLSSLKVSIDWTAGNFNLDVFSRFMINVMCCEWWAELEWKLFIAKLLIFSPQGWNPLPVCFCILGRVSAAILHVPVMGSVASTNATHWAVLLAAWLSPFPPAVCFFFCFTPFCTILHSQAQKPLPVYMNSWFDVWI